MSLYKIRWGSWGRGVWSERLNYNWSCHKRWPYTWSVYNRWTYSRGRARGGRGGRLALWPGLYWFVCLYAHARVWMWVCGGGGECCALVCVLVRACVRACPLSRGMPSSVVHLLPRFIFIFFVFILTFFHNGGKLTVTFILAQEVAAFSPAARRSLFFLFVLRPSLYDGEEWGRRRSSLIENNTSGWVNVLHSISFSLILPFYLPYFPSQHFIWPAAETKRSVAKCMSDFVCDLQID